MKRIKWIALALIMALLCTTVSPVFAETTDSNTTESASPHWEGSSYIGADGLMKLTGLNKISNKLYYFNSSGILVKNKIAVRIKANGKTEYYNINRKGVATKLSGTKKLAAKRLYALNKNKPVAATSKARMKVLKKAFLWSAKLRYVNNTKKYKGSKALKYYGEYGFNKRRGDCNTKATTFYWMAKVLGYSPKVVKGYIPRAYAGGKYSDFQAHAWVTIKMGKKYGFDPEFNRSSDAKALRKKNKYVGFKFRYGQKGTYKYHNAKKKLIKK